jgi:hypothetical protein
MHVNNSDPENYERRYPELKVVGYASRLCPECAPELAEGDRVLIRGDEINTGRVERVAACAGGFKLYRIQLESGEAATYPRSKLAKLPA